MVRGHVYLCQTLLIPVVIFIYRFCFAFALTALNKFIECITKGKLNLLNYFDLAIGLSSAHPVFLMPHQCS